MHYPYKIEIYYRYKLYTSTIERINMGFPLIINIEGNIGTGKSTILQKLQDELEIHYKNKVLFLKNLLINGIP